MPLGKAGPEPACICPHKYPLPLVSWSREIAPSSRPQLQTIWKSQSQAWVDHHSHDLYVFIRDSAGEGNKRSREGMQTAQLTVCKKVCI